ncbi:hypothetical protein [Lysinibacillus sp. Bpr_S20]|uniref:hypothetical protein n=1 Tax=Lysinibacillus sp. Bpr_S20 TaxID=2933964 RepID=UPI002010D830|nr:hypothetical protein [Lysinibacillus sp. Bpr_S20]MCL1700732.1 hypothetical protein [Lysinibacillus sp. Bpr_S20]
MKKKTLGFLSGLLLTGTLLGACDAMPESAQDKLSKDNKEKLNQSVKVMESVKTPKINYSVERENIAKRISVTNDANLLQWIYPMSAGRVIGRFPVRGKVTSGDKRLTSTQMLNDEGKSGGYSYTHVVEAPDEMGAYGSSGGYIFWFDPSGQYHQHKGDYFLTTEPYKLDDGNGTISVDIDENELRKVSEYDKQTEENEVVK